MLGLAPAASSLSVVAAVEHPRALVTPREPVQALDLSPIPMHFRAVRHSEASTSGPGPASQLDWSTYVTGTPTSATGHGVAVDALGNSYVTGSTDEGTDQMAFVAKYDHLGNPVYFTEFEAVDPTPGYDFVNTEAHGIAVDVGGNAYVTGKATHVESGNVYAFLMRLNQDGSILQGYGGGIGGTGRNNDSGEGVAVDRTGQATLTGSFIINGAQPDIFAVKFDVTGSRELWGNRYQFPGYISSTGYAIALDNSGNSAYVSGYIRPTGGDNDIFIWKFDNNRGGGSTIYGLTAPNPGDDALTGVAVNSTGNPYVVGTVSDSGTTKSYVAEINDDGSDLVFASVFDGTYSGTGIAMDGAGNSYITGSAPDPSDGSIHALIAEIDLAGDPVDATILRGDNMETGSGIAFRDGSASVTGSTSSTNLASDFTTLNGTQDVFLVHVSQFSG
jgi:hypothetical protein